MTLPILAIQDCSFGCLTKGTSTVWNSEVALGSFDFVFSLSLTLFLCMSLNMVIMLNCYVYLGQTVSIFEQINLAIMFFFLKAPQDEGLKSHRTPTGS